MATGGFDGTARVWSTSDGKELWRFAHRDDWSRPAGMLGLEPLRSQAGTWRCSLEMQPTAHGPGRTRIGAITSRCGRRDRRGSELVAGTADGLDVEPGMVRGAPAVPGIEGSHRWCRLFLEQAHACGLVASLQSRPPRSSSAGHGRCTPGALHGPAWYPEGHDDACDELRRPELRAYR